MASLIGVTLAISALNAAVSGWQDLIPKDTRSLLAPNFNDLRSSAW
jgi:hypothetical protein